MILGEVQNREMTRPILSRMNFFSIQLLVEYRLPALKKEEIALCIGILYN